MGLHKLEIEVTDEVLARIDAAAARANRSRADVVAERLKELPPAEPVSGNLSDEQKISRRLTFLAEISAQRDRLALPGRSAEEIDRDIRDFREDRPYER